MLDPNKREDVQRRHTILFSRSRGHEQLIPLAWVSLTRDIFFRSLLITHQQPMQKDEINGYTDLQLLPERTSEACVESDPKYFGGLTRHRVSRSLFQQMNLPLGEFSFIYLQDNILDWQMPRRRDSVILFGEKDYGAVVDVTSQAPQLEGLDKGVGRTLGLRSLPRSHEVLIIRRQMAAILCSLLSAETIIKIGPEGLRAEAISKLIRQTETLYSLADSLHARISIRSLPEVILLPGLAFQVFKLMCPAEHLYNKRIAEPIEFIQLVGSYCASRPDCVPDNAGRVPDDGEPEFLAVAFFDRIHDSNRVQYSQRSVQELLSLLHGDSGNKPFRYAIPQQLANVCRMEHTRARPALHREIQDYSAHGCFVRVVNALDAKENARVAMRDRYRLLAKPNTSLQALLSLAHKETSLTKADGILEVATIGISIDALKEPNAAEAEAINYLLHVADLIKNMSLIFVMPPASRTLEAMLVTKPRTMKFRMILAKPHFDIVRIMPAIVDPQEARAVHSTLNMLPECTRQFSGYSIPAMGESVISTCLAQTKKQSSYPQLKANVGQEVQQQCDANEEVVAAHKSRPMTTDDTTAQPAYLKKKKKKKKKSKGKSKPETDKQVEPAPKARSLLRRTALTQRVPPTQCLEPPQRKIRVSSSAAQVFTTLFDRSELRSGLHWANFEAAMAELNFRITPRQGSSFRFEPPEDLAVRSSLTVHRPHGPRVEGFRKLILSQRLARTFGWDA